MNGEWFNFTSDEINGCITLCNTLIEKIHQQIIKNTCDTCNYSVYKNEIFKKHMSKCSDDIFEKNDWKDFSRRIVEMEAKMLHLDNKTTELEKIIKGTPHGI
jgi:hypothetical protein